VTCHLGLWKSLKSFARRSNQLGQSRCSRHKCSRL